MGIVSKALGRDDEELQEPQDGAQEEQAEQQGGPAEEQQEPADNPQEEAAEQGGAADAWNRDKVLQTATALAFETMYSHGGAQALEQRLANSQDVPGDMVDIVVNVMQAALGKAQAAQRTIPPDTLQKLAMALVYEVLNVANIMGLVQQEQARPLAQKLLPQVLQRMSGGQAQPDAQPQQQQPAGLVGRAMAGGMQ